MPPSVDFLSQLSDAQRKAVEYVDGASLVIAGAGSGKTRVLTYKIAHLLSLGMAPWSIMALTFTNKAATEMRQRIDSLIGQDAAQGLWMGTFHSLFLRLLRMECDSLPFSPNFTIYDERDSQSLIKSIVKEMQLNDEPYKATGILREISKAKNALIDAPTYAANRELRLADQRNGRPALSDIYMQYAQRCLRANAMDFDDILLYTHQLLATHEDIRQKYEQRFQFLLVDEYQDTNYAQHEIVWQLTRSRQRLQVVGDDAQSIYSFRGARIDNILQFQHRYSHSRLFKLEQNYRSTKTIVAAADSLIHHNQAQIDKHTFSDGPEGEPITLQRLKSDIEEAKSIVRSINQLQRSKHLTLSSMAILYRTHAQSRIFEETLLKHSIPYRVYGGLSFYQRKEIKDLIAYLRLCINPNDDEALRRVINLPRRGIGDTTLSRLTQAATEHDISLFALLTNLPHFQLKISPTLTTKIADFVALISQHSQQALTLPAYDVATSILTHSGLQQEIAGDNSPEGKERQESIDEMLGALSTFCQQRHEQQRSMLLSEYLSEIALLTTADRPSKSQQQNTTTDNDCNDCVALMTIHAAKGLEFDCVFIPGLEQGLFPSEHSMSSSAALEEERRLLYVAITRARSICQLSYATSRFRNGQYVSCYPSLFIDNIDPKYIAHKHAEAYNPKTPINQQKQYHIAPIKATPTIPIEPAKPLDHPQRIRHERFGLGTIIATTGQGPMQKLTVRFDNCGLKQLLLKYAKIEYIHE